MRKQLSRIIPLTLLLALVLASMPMMAGALGSTISINPSRITDDKAYTITINGKGFIDGSTSVALDGAPISFTFRSSTRLRVQVPAGLSIGFHTISVTVGPDMVTCANCLEVTAPPPPTATLPYVRPQIVISGSSTNGRIATNNEIKLNLDLRNSGTSPAYSAQAAFTSTDLAPLENGGVVALGTINAGKAVDVSQRFLVTAETVSQRIAMVDVTVTYYDDQGNSFSDKFTMTLETSVGGASGGVVYPTATPTGVKNSQLVIPSYAVSIDPLQPGEQFTLTMTVQNVGNIKAQRVTMIVGGGSGGGSSDGTPQPGGVSGGSGEFTNFAPVGASNVQSLGDLSPGGMIQAAQNLIVNVSTNPGAYPMKVTFSYLNDKNEVINDEQVITLLVYSLPNVDVSFYRPPDPFFVGQPGALPIQVVNIGKRSSVLGNLKITSDSGMVENGTGLVGSLDAGGYFTLDSMFIPEQSGTQVLTITIDYTDDFNQARTLTRKLEIEVMEGMTEEPIIDPSMPGEGGGGGGEFPVPSAETPLQKVWRFVLGLLGLDSAPPADGGGEQIPPEMEPAVPEVKPGAGKG